MTQTHLTPANPPSFQDFMYSLCQYWTQQGCLWGQPYDAPMGAGTFHPHTFLRGLGPEPWKSVYVQPCRRPVDGRYGKSPYRFQHYYQLQVLLKPAPENIVDLFLGSLEHIGLSLTKNDVGLLEDDWKGPTLGAWGLGWEVRANGQEVTQFTYFQQLGGLDVDVVCGEITYGLERLYMYLYGYENALDIPYNEHFTYGDIFLNNEEQFSTFNFEQAPVEALFQHFIFCEGQVRDFCQKNLVLPAYDYVLSASHTFNLLDSRGAISATERQRFIGRVRDCAKLCAKGYLESRKKAEFPLLKAMAKKTNITVATLNKNQTPHETKLYNHTQFKPHATCSFLFELGVEELPPAFQTKAKAFLQEQMEDFLKQKKSEFKQEKDFLTILEKIQWHVEVSARRLSLQCSQLPVFETSRRVEVWGPAERIAKDASGGLSQAGLGFCRKNNLEPQEVSFKERADGVFLYAQKTSLGRDLPTLLSECLTTWCTQIPAPLKMRWLEKNDPRFVRPVRWCVALVDDQVLPLKLFGVESGRFTYGQRILAPGPIVLNHANEYENKLKKAHVILSQHERYKKIQNDGNTLLQKKLGSLVTYNHPVWSLFKQDFHGWDNHPDKDLIEKSLGLSESPYVFLGSFPEKFLRLPALLIRSVLKEHMNFFCIKKASNELAPHFIGVAHYPCEDSASMIKGAENVVIGRLEDGAFYYDTDLATNLETFRERLKNVVFQDGMGTLFEKTERLVSLTKNLLPLFALKGEDQPLEIEENLAYAAKYSKADLRTGCVQEFPDEMQGRMGEILILNEDPFQDKAEPKSRTNRIARAVGGQYFSNRDDVVIVDLTPEAKILALADRLDSLCLMMFHGVEVSENKDPLGLRRLAMGILYLLDVANLAQSLPNEVPTSWKEEGNIRKLVALTLRNLGLEESQEIFVETKEKIVAFIVERLKGILQAEGYDGETILVVESLLAQDGLAKIFCILKTLKAHPSHLEFFNAREIQKRLKNTLKNNTACKELPPIKHDFLLIKCEQELFLKIEWFEKNKDELKNKNFIDTIQLLNETFIEALEKFYRGVMIFDKEHLDLQINRLSLLKKVYDLYSVWGDFSHLSQVAKSPS